MNRLIAFCLLVTACPSGGSSASLSGAELRRRLLDYQGTRFPQRQFVVGLGAGPTLEAATQSAFGEITRQLTWLPAGSQDLLHGMYRVERSATDTDGQVQALASLERDEASSHLRRLGREAEQLAANRLLDCRRLLHAGEIEQTDACLTRGEAELSRASDLIAVAQAAVGDSAPALRAALPTQAQYAELRRQSSAGRISRRSVLVHVIKEVDGRIAGDLDETFAPAATESGFKRIQADLGTEVTSKALAGGTAALLQLAHRTGAGYALVGRVRSRFSSEDSGQYFAMADGVLKLLETTGGRSVVELACNDVKGGHISREQALDKAVSEAVQRLLLALRPRLRELAGGN